MPWGNEKILGGTLSPEPSFLTIELMVFVLFVYCVRHALRIGRGLDERHGRSWAPLCAMAGTLIFTFIVEYKLGDPEAEASIYAYPESSYLLYLLRVPVWIPVGWAFVVYVAMRTSDKLEPNWKIRPVLDGLLALNLDFALDPVAEINEWWTWKLKYLVFRFDQLVEGLTAAEQIQLNQCVRQAEVERVTRSAGEVGDLQAFAEPGKVGPADVFGEYFPADLVKLDCLPWNAPGYSDFFGIPLSNFFAWFIIVAGFSFAFRLVQHKILLPRGWRGLGWGLVAAGLAVLPALGLVKAYKEISKAVVQSEHAVLGGVVLFAVFWGAAVLLVASRWFRYPTDCRLDRLLWLAPLWLHGFFFFQLFVTKGYVSLPELTIFLPTTAAVAMFVFGWPYLDDLRRIVRERGWLALFDPRGVGEGG